MKTLKIFGVPSLFAIALVFSAEIQAQSLVNWSSNSLGTVSGTSVTFSGGGRTLIDDPVGTSQTFSLINMTAPISTTQYIEFTASSSTPTVYTMSFDSAVSGVMLHLASLASTITFDRPITKLSGQATFVVDGTTVAGSTVQTGGFSDANGSIFLGNLQTFSFTVGTFPGGEGIGIQVVTGVTPVPEPTALSLMMLGIAGVVAYCRRKPVGVHG